MATFTMQQMVGAKGYRPRTFVGNWNEDIQYQEDQMKEHMRKRANGELLSQKITGKIKQHKTPARITPLRESSHVHFGDTVVLQSSETEGLLCVDLDDQITPPPHQKFAVTTAKAPAPFLRNTWTIVKIPNEEDEIYDERGEGHILHYGQRFRLMLNDQLRGPSGKPLFLWSEKLTPSCYSKVTKAQEVSVADHGTLGLAWQVLYANPEYRFETERQPVVANEMMVLNHVQTGELLSSNKKTYINDFGAEHEVCACKAYHIKSKTHKEAPEMPTNRWAFVYGVPEEGEEGEQHAEEGGC